MQTTLRPFLDRWRFCALLASILMLAVAHGFQTFGGFAPCELCLRQREAYWVAAGIAAGREAAINAAAGGIFAAIRKDSVAGVALPDTSSWD